MKRKIILIILILVINVMFLNINVVKAAGISDVISGGGNFIQAGEGQGTTIDEEKLKSTSNMIYNILLVLGMCIAVLVSGILGIKFMIGSTEEKAQVKETLIPFIVGCVVIFGAFGIWKIFITIGNDFETAKPPVTSEDVMGYEKGDWHCNRCGSKIIPRSIEQGRCLSPQCSSITIPKECTCKDKLDFNDYKNKKCSTCRKPLSLEGFTYHD